MKWLAAGVGVAVVVLVILLREVLSGNAPPVVPDAAPRTAGIHAPRQIVDGPVAAVRTDGLEEAPPPAWPDDPDAGTTEFRVRGAEFFERVDLYPRQRLPEFVADCYQGGEDRHAKLKLKYRLVIEKHVVSLRDIKVDTTTFKNPELTACMIKALEAAHFEDIEMPDFISPENEPETLLIRIQALKRFYPKQENGTP